MYIASMLSLHVCIVQNMVGRTEVPPTPRARLGLGLVLGLGGGGGVDQF